MSAYFDEGAGETWAPFCCLVTSAFIRMGKWEVHTKFQPVILNGRDLGILGRIILIWVLQQVYEGIECIQFDQSMVQWPLRLTW